ncbi:FecR family protein [Oleomonas cavernae]|nr:FecR family protein [Oleomonas cavernae]
MAILRAAWAASGLLAGLLIGLMPIGAGDVARADTAAAGLVLNLRGSAEATRETVQRPLSPEDSVFTGDAVATGAKSRIEIRLGRDTTIAIGENGRVKIDDFLAEAGGEISLEAGALMLDKDPESVARPIKVNSDFGQIAVRGTNFFAGPSRGSFGVLLLRGHVVVTAAGTSVELKAGEGTDIAYPGAPPSPPKVWAPERVEEALAQLR